MSEPIVVHERRRGKNWYASKTLWLNILGALVAILFAMSQSPSLAGYSEWFMLAQSILNIILRVFFTSQAVRS